MLWGMPTLVEFGSFEDNLKCCRSLGLDFIELNMNLPMFQPDMLAALPSVEDVFYTIHLDENFSPADFSPIISEAWMETIRRTIGAARQIGAPVINMHLNKGVYFTLPEQKVFLFERYRDAFLRKVVNLRSLCEREIGNSNIRVCIENTGGYPDFQKAAIDILLESDAFALTWDIGHWHKGRIDDAPFMLDRRSRLKHFHVHDAGPSGDHLALGDGEIDIGRMVRLAEQCGARCVVETKTAYALAKSVEWLKEHGFM